MTITIEDINDSFSTENEPKRLRNQHFVNANALAKQYHSLIYEGNFDRFTVRRDISKEIVDQAKDYAISTKESVIWLYGQDGKNRFHYFIPYFHRFRKEYIKRQIIKLNYAFRDLEIKHTMIFVTLTIDPSLFYSIYQGYVITQREVNKLLTYLRKKYSHLFRYVKVSEIQEKNTKNIHYHIAMSVRGGIDWNIKDFDKIESIIKTQWKIGFSDVKLVTESKKNGLKHYMLKYLEKSLQLEDNEINENNAILWALNSRIFSFSNIKKWREANDLMYAEGVKNNSTERIMADSEIVWEYEGTFQSIDIGYLRGLYSESQLSEGILEILYRRRFSLKTTKANDNG